MAERIAYTFTIEVRVPASAEDQDRFDRAKMREAQYNENWKKQMVNINEIVDEFCPGFLGKGEKKQVYFQRRAI